jgi:hypothetical protein
LFLQAERVPKSSNEQESTAIPQRFIPGIVVRGDLAFANIMVG